MRLILPLASILIGAFYFQAAGVLINGNQINPKSMIIISTESITGTGNALTVPNGNVGIMNSIPSVPLDVTGDAHFGELSSYTPYINTTSAGRTVRYPAYSFYGDTGTGMFVPNIAHNILFAVNQSTAIWIDSSGNMAIGYVTPTTRLDVYGDVRSTGSLSASYGNFSNSAATTTFSGWADFGAVDISSQSYAQGLPKSATAVCPSGYRAISCFFDSSSESISPTALINAKNSCQVIFNSASTWISCDAICLRIK